MKFKLNGEDVEFVTWSSDLKQGQFGIISDASDVYHGEVLFCAGRSIFFLRTGEKWEGTHAVKVVKPGDILEILMED